MSNKIIILTGDTQTGKTTLLQEFCRQQKKIAGILSPIVNGKRQFYDISTTAFFDMEANGNEKKLAVGKYFFSAAAFKRANNILLDEKNSPAINYLVIDEIGPLEFRQFDGLYSSFKEIISAPFHYTLIVVIRQSLVNEFTKAFNFLDVEVLTIAQLKAHLGVV